MFVQRNYHANEPDVKVEFWNVSDFRDFVEWLGTVAPHDGATQALQQELRRIDPPPVEEAA